MPLRAPHRRISPRTKRRCRAIKEFFKKTIGTLSQTDSRTHSSIELSVSDLQSKIDIIEQHLDKVSKHCRDLSFLEHNFRKGESTTSHEIKQTTPSKPACESSRTRDIETKILYETPRRNYTKSHKSQSMSKWGSDEIIMNDNKHFHKVCNKEYVVERPCNIPRNPECRFKHFKPISHPKSKRDNNINEDNLKRVYSSISLQSPRESYNKDTCQSRYQDSHRRHRKIAKGIENVILRECEDTGRLKPDNKKDTERRKTRKKSHHYSNVDKDFIADIIRKQYKPVKLFGRRLSDFSQFSAPVCRDQEFTIRNDVMEGSELCSCCFEGHRKVRHRHCERYNLSDMRSICDARLYSSKQQRRYKQSHITNYNDSNLYDLVPVKEKSSPKSRRKFIEENNKRHERFREVLPSPRTNRPRLNLTAQRYAYDDMILPNVTHRSLRKKPPLEVIDDYSDLSRYRQMRRDQGPNKTQDGGTLSSLQYPNIEPKHVNINNETMHTQVTSCTVDKTDKALCEIKDILQSFLHEIKRESIHSHSEMSSKSIKQSQTQVNDQSNSHTTPKINQSSFINNSSAQYPPPPIVPSFNPCCYPVLPICPINYSPNSFMVPSPSYTCATCTHNCQENVSYDNNVNKTSVPSCHHETQELIKEIYKCVARNGNCTHARRASNENVRQIKVEKKILTSRSVGSSKASKHDAMVETPKMKCHSKSCEAIGSRMTSESCYSTNPTLSDTVIEKLNLQTSRSSSETEMEKTCEAKKNKISKVLNRFGLFKRKKKDVIEEVSESESTIEVEVMPHTRPPFKQNILNYNVHAQECFNRPRKARCCPAHDSLQEYACGNDYVSQEFTYDICKHGQHPQAHSTPQRCPMLRAPTCCHDHNHHDPPQIPQVPLCLKEIEVKSIGTQSDRKLSLLPRFKKKVQSAQMQLQQHSTITTQTPKERNIILNWEKLKQKATKNVSSNSDPLKFSIKTQKELALGDTKMRNAMLKKLFYKRNPFSPRNLIVRTLLGKDKSSWGDPPRMYKPRMFI
ncbi:uncharacterized protein LOC123708941 [Pieris brassicae]|uniref:uncharacterized protein LOC123708941 n=1 Tax=Pieris brassicae TaxID=7116 RepID=UPI001E66015B|nr:uncharacterized protein LOC123708941 [Pieris brassicae]XP_045515933.1 uncharacterized protein LOC123708941 [Pieris brassicae]